MFYNAQETAKKEEYKQMLSIMGNLTRLFANDKIPYLPYRCQENIFCKYFNAENLGRRDCSADARKDGVGIGLKTWMGQDDQKVAEFGKLKEKYENLDGLDLVKTISTYRNERIRVTKRIYALDKMIYHIVKRMPNTMKIFECAFDEIDIDNITLIKNRGNNNNTYFTDGKHTYHFSTSKNTLYMIFDDMDELDSFNVEILEDPYTFLLNAIEDDGQIPPIAIEPESKIASRNPNSICLRLYSTRDKEKFVGEKSGLNQWNAGGRPRNANEIYINYPAQDRIRNPGFFPPRDESFELKLPNGQTISAKVCQDNSKAIMSNPNSKLGEWLLRDVLQLPERTILTYGMLEILDIDSVIFTKIGEKQYTIDFAPTGTYEDYYDEKTETE